MKREDFIKLIREVHRQWAADESDTRTPNEALADELALRFQGLPRALGLAHQNYVETNCPEPIGQFLAKAVEEEFK